MKKIVTVFAFALICSGAFAQFNQGRSIIGGNLGFNSQTVKLDANNSTTTQGKITNIAITPQFGYFIIDNLAVGAGVDWTSRTDKADGSDDKTTTSKFTFNPFVRYYLDPGVFFQGRVGFGGGVDKEKNGSTTTTTKHGVFLWDIGVGYAWFLNDHVSIEPLVKYGMTVENYKDNDVKVKYGIISVNIGITAYLGERN